ncbi:hypothetical protein U14_05154 [Candidatus Moduliflexus flocculans]|uniref:Uncharacterized protein n=1 Tax=Candidatus Moduliflexus flocculans TaxID=1499966 RepID=A0A081BR48_9BACT|nr:hypothetical protein U14_05154 [Candidatus Moduliflexus flocculans]
MMCAGELRYLKASWMISYLIERADVTQYRMKEKNKSEQSHAFDWFPSPIRCRFGVLIFYIIEVFCDDFQDG